MMKRIKQLALVAALCISGLAMAGANDPLFINMTTDEAHRADMALVFGARQHDRGHALTLFLNDRGVLVASKANATKYADHQKAIADIIAKGGSVIICPMCMRHYGVKEADLVPGVRLGSPDLTGAALFKDNTKTLTW